MNQTINLAQSATGFQGLIARIGGDKTLKRKLMSLGLRQGQEITILHQRKNGVVVLSNGSRVALGAGIAANIFLEPLAEPSPETQD